MKQDGPQQTRVVQVDGVVPVLKRAELLYDLRDGVDGLGLRQQTVADGNDDVKRTLQKFSGMSPIQLPRPVNALDTVPAVTRHRLLYY